MNTHMNIKYWQTDYAYTYNMYMTTSNGECQQGPWITSTYVPKVSNDPPSTKEPKDIKNYCGSRNLKKKNIASCGILQEKTLDEMLLEYLLSLSLIILIIGNKSALLAEYTDIIDPTLQSNDVVEGWHVSYDSSLS